MMFSPSSGCSFLVRAADMSYLRFKKTSFNFQLSTFIFHLSTFNFQFSIFNFQLSITYAPHHFPHAPLAHRPAVQGAPHLSPHPSQNGYTLFPKRAYPFPKSGLPVFQIGSTHFPQSGLPFCPLNSLFLDKRQQTTENRQGSRVTAVLSALLNS